jgi:trans-aconitate 2-methyltransferase
LTRAADWNPAQYERFKAERRQPFTDLVSLIERTPSMRVVDLGCGTGELTRALHDALQAERTTGIDNSEAMLRNSSAFKSDRVRFELRDIQTWSAVAAADLVFSNAALHWLPNHPALFATLTASLRDGGQLAVQMPANDDHLSHRTAAAIAKEMGFEPKETHVLPVERYAEILHGLGYQRQNVRMQIYGHLLPSLSDVVEWVKGTLLTDYEKRLGTERFADFLQRYRERLMASLPTGEPYFYTYKRVLIWAAK